MKRKSGPCNVLFTQNQAHSIACAVNGRNCAGPGITVVIEEQIGTEVVEKILKRSKLDYKLGIYP